MVERPTRPARERHSLHTEPDESDCNESGLSNYTQRIDRVIDHLRENLRGPRRQQG